MVTIMIEEKELMSRRAVLSGMAVGAANTHLGAPVAFLAKQPTGVYLASKAEFRQHLDRHERWLHNCARGERLCLPGLTFTGPLELTNHNLALADLRACNLAGATFRGVEFRNTNLQGANLRGARFRDCCGIGTDLSDACLDGASFMNCSWLASSFRRASLRSLSVPVLSPSTSPEFQSCDFSHSKLDDAVFGGVLLGMVRPMLQVTDCSMIGASMRGVVIQGAMLVNTSFEGADFARLTLGPDVSFKDSELTKLDLSEATVRVSDIGMLALMVAIVHSVAHGNPHGLSIAGVTLHISESLSSCTDRGVITTIADLPYQFRTSSAYADILGMVFQLKDFGPADLSLESITFK